MVHKSGEMTRKINERVQFDFKRCNSTTERLITAKL